MVLVTQSVALSPHQVHLGISLGQPGQGSSGYCVHQRFFDLYGYNERLRLCPFRALHQLL